MVGVVLALAASGGWGADAVLSRLGLAGLRVSLGTLVSLAASLAALLVAALALNSDGLAALSLPVVGWFAMTGLVNYPLGRRLNYQAIHHLGPARATPIISSAPLFAILFAAVFAGEAVTLPVVIGAVMVVGGIALVASGSE